ncbi:MAG: hypothetical protein U9R42_10135, partial [Bacteroidota bacterium]|nr:hypothetical protein [Bacteroidota bacterium]
LCFSILLNKIKKTMKKNILFLFLSFFFLSNLVFASNADLFSYNKEKILDEFSKLTLIENYVLQHEDATYTKLKINNPNIDFSLNPNLSPIPNKFNMTYDIDETISVIMSLACCLLCGIYIWRYNYK